MQEREIASYPLFASLSKRERETVARYLDQVDVPLAASSRARATSLTSSS